MRYDKADNDGKALSLSMPKRLGDSNTAKTNQVKSSIENVCCEIRLIRQKKGFHIWNFISCRIRLVWKQSAIHCLCIYLYLHLELTTDLPPSHSSRSYCNFSHIHIFGHSLSLSMLQQWLRLGLHISWRLYNSSQAERHVPPVLHRFHVTEVASTLGNGVSSSCSYYLGAQWIDK